MDRGFWRRRRNGFTLGELMVSVVLLGVIIAVLLPALAPRPRGCGGRIKCVNNLKNIGLAFRIFAADNQDRFPMQVPTNEGGSLEFLNDGSPLRHFVALSNELSTPKLIVCPVDPRRNQATQFSQTQQQHVSYFVGLDAREGTKTAFLAGDRNLSINGRPLRPGLINLRTNGALGWTKEIHNLEGNIAMVDGHVEQLTTPRLVQALRLTGMPTNRVAVP